MESKVTICILLQLQLGIGLGQNFVGDPCVPNINNPKGYCTLVSECDLAQRQMMLRTTHSLTRCANGNKQEVVCCPVETDPLEAISSTTETGVTASKRIADNHCQQLADDPFCQPDVLSTERIVNGKLASFGEFPHMVALGYDQGDGYDFKCGGAVISKDFVLTAAHCVGPKQIRQPTIVRTSVVEIDHKRSSSFDNTTDVAISEIITHPLWHNNLNYHDLALIRLHKSLSFSCKLNAACLETSNDNPKLQLIITGWGQITVSGERSRALRKANVTSVSTTICNESFGSSPWRKLPQGIIDKQICAGISNDKTDTCLGDSGGPLQIKIDEKILYRLVGVTSFGRGCGSVLPGIYTRVASYIDWIVSVVWPQN